MKKDKNKKIKIFLIIIIVIITTIGLIKLSAISVSYIKNENLKSEIKNIMNDLNYNTIEFKNSKFSKDNIIDKLEFNADEDSFNTYIYNKSEIYNIVNKKNNKEIYSNKKLTLKNNQNEDVIILIQGLFGAYGKIDINDSNPKLKYYLPEGKYKFRKLKNPYVKNSKENPSIYIQKNININNSHISTKTIKEIEFNNDFFTEVDILPNTFLDISNDAIFEVQKISK